MIDKNEAPEGYEAIKKDKDALDGCKGCIFTDADGCCNCPHTEKDYVGCTISNRKDKENVIFIKKSTLEDRLNTLTIGKCIPIDGGLYATKIPQGWIYESIDESGTSGGCCFVPETKEVDWEKGHDR